MSRPVSEGVKLDFYFSAAQFLADLGCGIAVVKIVKLDVVKASGAELLIIP